MLKKHFEVIELVRKTIEETQCQSLLWCGDINTDFRRSTGQVELVKDVMEQLQLQKAWDMFNVDFTRMCSENENVTTSIIDHFFYSNKFSQSVLEAGAIHSPDNSSDHCPVYIVFRSLKVDNAVF